MPKKQSNDKIATGYSTLQPIEGFDEDENPVYYKSPNIRGIYCICPDQSAIEPKKKYMMKVGAGGLGAGSTLYSRLNSYGTVYPNGWWNICFLICDTASEVRDLENQCHEYFKGQRFSQQFIGRTRHEWFVLTMKQASDGFRYVFEKNKKKMKGLEFVECATWKEEHSSVIDKIKKFDQQFE